MNRFRTDGVTGYSSRHPAEAKRRASADRRAAAAARQRFADAEARRGEARRAAAGRGRDLGHPLTTPIQTLRSRGIGLAGMSPEMEPDQLMRAAASTNELLPRRRPRRGSRDSIDAFTPASHAQPRLHRTVSGNYEFEELPELSFSQRANLSPEELFDYDKRRSTLRVKGFARRLSLRSDVLKYKLTAYNRWYEGSQVLVIVISVFIGIMTGISAELVTYSASNQTSLFVADGIREADMKLGFNISVFLLSSFNAFVVAFVNARRWKDTAIAMDGVLGQASQVKNELHLAEGRVYRIQDADSLREFHIEFDATVFIRYLTARNEIDKVLSRQSLTKHLNMYYDTNVQRARDHTRYRSELAESARYGSADHV